MNPRTRPINGANTNPQITLNIPDDSNKEGFPTFTPDGPFSTKVNPSKADIIVCVPLKGQNFNHLKKI